MAMTNPVELLQHPLVVGRLELGGAGSAAVWRPNVETLSATKTLVGTSPVLQVLDPGGSSRNLVFPVETGSTNLLFIVQNTADAAENIVCKASDTSTTVATIGQNETGILYCDGTTWRGIVIASGGASGSYLLADGTVTGATSAAQPLTNGWTATPSLSAAGASGTSSSSMNHATARHTGLDIAVASVTTARTTGSTQGVRVTPTGLAGDGAGADYSAFNAHNAALNGGSASAYALKQGTGYTTTIDSSTCASAETGWRIPDNVAVAFDLKQGANSYLQAVSADGSEQIKTGAIARWGHVPVGTQTVGAGDTIASGSAVQPVTSAGAVTTGTTTSITDGVFTGQVLIVVNVGAQNITIDKNAKTMTPAGADVVLVPASASTWYWDATRWICLGVALNA